MRDIQNASSHAVRLYFRFYDVIVIENGCFMKYRQSLFCENEQKSDQYRADKCKTKLLESENNTEYIFNSNKKNERMVEL